MGLRRLFEVCLRTPAICELWRSASFVFKPDYFYLSHYTSSDTELELFVLTVKIGC